MRLLDARTLELHEFMDDAIPDYAILSHRWQAATEEVSFKDMQDGMVGARDKAGFEKIRRSCAIACERNIGYVWIDTCCIDKSSSAELSEAINSMFRWYREAKVCLAFLFDVDSSEPGDPQLPFKSCFAKSSNHRVHSGSAGAAGVSFSSWFTRSWTLQELLAPDEVEFYDGQWRLFGSKRTLSDEIFRITGISSAFLSSPMYTTPSALRRVSIATKMSWASERIASRKEDLAYSLLGLFEVNMPLLYGEGERAFIRLQEEIMKHSDDHSLFAWTSSALCQRGLSAKSPADFRGCDNIYATPKLHSLHRAPFSVTNMGLSIELLMLPWQMEVYLAAIDCTDVEGSKIRLAIFLQLLDEDGQYARVVVDNQDIIRFPSERLATAKVRKAYIRQSVWDTPKVDSLYGFWLRGLPTSVDSSEAAGGYEIAKVTTWNKWDDTSRIFEIPTGERGTAGVIWFKFKSAYSSLRLGFDDDFNIMAEMEGPLWYHNEANQQQLVDIGYFKNPIDHDLDPTWIQKWNANLLKFNIGKIPRLSGAMLHRPNATLSIWETIVKGTQTRTVDIELIDRSTDHRRVLVKESGD